MSVITPEPRRDLVWVMLPVAFAFVLVATVWLRYGGRWSENDTVVLTAAARAVVNEGTIAPRSYTYDNGFAYPVLLATLTEVTGLPIRDLQTTVLPWLTVATALVAVVAFRAVIGSGRAAALSAMLLLVQPDFLFVNQRGSHEKMTWTLVLAIIYVLMASLKGKTIGQVAPYVIIFYICGFALICSNAFFGSSFATVIMLALVGSVVFARRFFQTRESRIVLPRLGSIFLILNALVYLVIFYIYVPASSSVGTLARVSDRIAALYLSVDAHVETNVTASTGISTSAVVDHSTTVSSPYAAISLGWRSPEVFFLLTAFTWILIVASVFAWFVLAVTFVRRGVSRQEIPLFLIWTFLAAAAVQIAMSVASDFAGVLGGNMQLRLFPVYTLFAIPLVVATILRYRRPPRSSTLRWLAIAIGLFGPTAMAVAYPGVTAIAAPAFLLILYIYFNWGKSLLARRVAFSLGTLACSYFVVAAVLKATNDPLVSNKWVFYSAQEARSMQWGNRHLPETFIWSEFDERLQANSQMLLADRGNQPSAIWTIRQDADTVRYVMLSDVTSERAVRISGILPSTEEDDRIYDNGGARISHRVPDTPYQP